MIPVRLSGTYECLPLKTPSSANRDECTFGNLSEDGVDYAVNFGQSADSMRQFQKKQHILAEGFIVPRESLNTDMWGKYMIGGIFTITETIK